MDAVVAEVRGAPDGAAAKAALVERHGLSMEQVGWVGAQGGRGCRVGAPGNQPVPLGPGP